MMQPRFKGTAKLYKELKAPPKIVIVIVEDVI